MTEPTEPLKNCPFCGAGESQIHVNKGTWNGRGYGEPVSVEVRHWCADVPGQPSRMISRAGCDEASAIAAWNTRTTPQPTHPQAGAVPLTDEQIRAMLNKHPPEDVCGWSYRMGIDDAELHHGIKGKEAGNAE